MATQKTIAEIIQIAKISITIASNKVSEDVLRFGKSPDKKIPIRIYRELQSVEYLYLNYPSADSTRSAANYLYDLCWPFNRRAEAIIADLGGDPPVVTGPSNVTVQEGAIASFSITVTSTSAYTTQWYRGVAPIVGATSDTYSFTAVAGDNGADFHAVATNTAGSTTSSTGLLTVTTQIVGSYYIGDTDYFAALNGGTDAITYLGTFNITDGQPIAVVISDPSSTLGNNKFHVYKYPKTQGFKVQWRNNDLNNGTLTGAGDQAFRNIIEIGNYYYIVSRVQISIITSDGMLFT